MRIDQLTVRLDGAELEDGDLPVIEDLAEGQGLSDLLLSRDPVTKLIVAGRLWNEPITHTAKPSRSEGDRWAALVFGSALVNELSEAEMMTLATRGGAVSPVTSYLAVEPGIRPAREIGGFGRGVTCDCDAANPVDHGSGGLAMRGAGFDPQAWLETELGDAWRRCGGAGTTGAVELETMSAEILDVDLKPALEPDAKVKACMMQLIWTLELPSGFDQRERWTVTL